MRLRNKGILLYLNEKELNHLNKQVKKTGLTTSTYLRKLIMGKEIIPLPPEKYFKVLSQLNRVSCDISYFVRMAYCGKNISYQEIRETEKKFEEIMCLVYQFK